jgi:hypothetical protein
MLVEVVTHFNEDGFSQGMLMGLADRIRAATDDVRCPEHGEEPTVRLSTEGIAQTLNEISVEVSGCCPAAAARVVAVLDQVRAAVAATHPPEGGEAAR